MPGAPSLARYPRVARLFDAATNLYEGAFRSLDGRTPPWRIRKYVGPFGDPRDYQRSAARQLEGLRALGTVSPTSAILDVGCGTGRLASALTGFLARNARYEGLDPQPIPIRWCREHISTSHPNFRFQETGTFSPKYNPLGPARPEQYRFPFEDATFDLVLLLSVLTHVGREVELSMLRESCRVLSPHGRIVLTQYLLDAKTRPLAEAGVTNPRFPYVLGEDRTQTPDTPEGFAARDEAWAKSTWELVGLAPTSIRPGSWAGPTRPADEATIRYEFFQDLVILAHRDDGRS